MRKKLSIIRSQFNWRMLVVRGLMYAALLGIVVLLVPGIYFKNVNNLVLLWLVTAIGFGVVSAIVRPIVQFFTLPFIFTTYGLAVVLINIVVLLVFDWLFSSHFAVDGVLAAILGGLLITLIGGLLESLLGLTAPIVPDSEEALSQRIRFQDRGMAYALFQAAPAELRKYAPIAGNLEASLPSSPDTQDAQAILDTLNGAKGLSTTSAMTESAQ
jgi:putative membrane protein